MLTDEMLSRLDTLRIALKAYARGGAGGYRRSKALGDSAEFSDFREYALGDDLRRIDWNAFARFDKLFLKLFMEEQEMHLTLILDASRSMDYGEPKKWGFALDLTQALAYMALTGGDRVTLAIPRESGVKQSPAFSGRPGYFQALSFLQDVTPAGKTELTRAVSRMPLKARRGMAVIISDLFSEDGSEGALASLQYRGQQAAVLHILSPEELAPRLSGALRLMDSEGGPFVDLSVGPEVLRAYHKALDGFVGGLRGYCHRRDIPYALLRSDMDLMKEALGNLTQSGVIA